jgi:hypothetical protein
MNVVDTSGVAPLHQVFLFLKNLFLLKYNFFMQAAFNGFVSCVRRLVQLGAKADMRDETGEYSHLHRPFAIYIFLLFYCQSKFKV